MTREDIPRPTPETIVRYLEQNPPEPSNHPHPGAHGTVREAEHRGHHIMIRTTYEIEVDGVPIEGHLGVTDDGNVHYHPVPNVTFASAVDLVKQLIDAFPDDFSSTPGGPPGPGHDHGAEDDHGDHEHGAGHEHDHGSHGGQQH